MLNYTRNRTARVKRTGSTVALGIALACGGVLGVTALEAPAFAQKKSKKDEAPKNNYSKAFVAAYSPVNDLLQAEPKDNAAIAAGIPTVLAAVETPDDKFAAGNMLYSFGRTSTDTAMQRKGLDMMIESGKVPAESLADYNFTAGQLAYQAKDWATARTRLQAAVDAGLTSSNPQAIIAETYFSQDMYEEGLKYLADEINKRVAAGEEVDPVWLKRGITVAYNNNFAESAGAFARMNAKMFPAKDSWGDAIAIQRNFNEFDAQETLDLLRLAKRTGSLRSERDYVDYIEVADARRLPGEVVAAVDQGTSAGLVNSSDVFIAESLSTAKSRLNADQADLPALERDARKASSTAVTAAAAGDAFLSYGKAAQAEEMYTIALGKTGTDMPRVLTRLGIAQVDQGKTEEAKATFAKVTGNREPIAKLWSVYAEQKASGTPVETAAAM
ncbi:hypothetical protein [Allopontixanthobacter sediminis]|uniref:Tetratricopeptide repeat protein n=1 Tax=Allopontixanthobacter sediminis TaxID=1689985 RepID=A0A845AZC6_9SPHN|nr:hypothetical protein [Allopontixanthobacter sediminis]MXP43580.1 hypothetical protein [Allopontixanthobacter sediminis]